MAFANSTRAGEYAIIFLGVKDDATIVGVSGTDGIQKSINSTAANDCTPPIICEPRVLKIQGMEIIAVVIPTSIRKPHFSGHAFIRVGSENKKANEQMLNELIASRNDTCRRLQEVKGKVVSLELWPPKNMIPAGL